MQTTNIGATGVGPLIIGGAHDALGSYLHIPLSSLRHRASLFHRFPHFFLWMTTTRACHAAHVFAARRGTLNGQRHLSCVSSLLYRSIIVIDGKVLARPSSQCCSEHHTGHCRRGLPARATSKAEQQCRRARRGSGWKGALSAAHC